MNKKFFKGVWLIIKYGPARVAEWQSQAIYDSLTGIYNRQFFREAGKGEIARARRLEKDGISYPLALIFVDLKKFRDVNNHEGHAAGDESLRRVAAFLRKACQRETDIVARVGGDEFAILLPQTNKAGAQVVVDKIRSAVNELFSPGGRPIKLNCGVAEAGEVSLEELISQADKEMYQDKQGLKT